MAQATLTNGRGQRITLDGTTVDQLRAKLRGSLLQPDDPGYDEARTIWNAMIDRRPAIIVRCVGVADVVQAVNFAREHDLLVAVRGGGHNIAGNAVCDGGLMIDLSAMKSVRVDPVARRAFVEPGATLGDMDRETQAFGLATPLGINSTTGVAGLTLGGGFGWLSRKHGMTVDNLVSADVVTADGKLVRANEKENAELFWGIRGGGGNLGIVTMFEFQLHPVGPEVFSGLIVYPLDQAKTVLTRYAEFVKGMSDDLCVWVVMRKAPPLPFLPQEVHGKEVVVLAACHAGDPGEGQRAVAPLLSFGKPVGQHLGVQPYTAWQSAFDPLLTPGARNYWKSHNLTNLTGAAIDAVVQQLTSLPSPQCEIFFGLIGGKASRIPRDATAYAHRDTLFAMNIHGRWEQASEDERGIAWTRHAFQSMTPYATGGVYVNFMTQEETDRVGAAYGPSYERLRGLKRRYDPTNLFRLNQNIAPA
ncbi:MAG: FAD-binding oxidoreductase [Chloroflexi bacterium]|nr:FAD-binding oxidoreductase [Chloroflexota bacterium]